MSRRDIEKIERFITRAALSEDPPAVKVSLCQLVGGRTNRVQDWRLREDSKAGELAAEIHAVASADAEGLGGRQRYVVTAWAEGDLPAGRSPAFALHHVTEIDPGDGGDSDPPTREGQTAQLMRHTEQLHRILATTGPSVIATQAQIIARYQDREDAMIAKHLEVLTLVEQLVDQRAERELEARKATASIDHKDRIVKSVELMVPTVAMKLNRGKEVPMLPVKVTPELEILMQVFGDLTPAKFQALMALFPDPATQGALASLYERLATHAATTRAGANGSPADPVPGQGGPGGTPGTN